MIIILVVCVLLLVLGIINRVVENKTYDQQKESYSENVRRYQEEYDRLIGQVDQKVNLPHLENGQAAITKAGDLVIYEDRPARYPYFEHLRNGSRILKYEENPGIKVLAKIKVHDVMYWAEKGTLQFTSNVSGGGSNLAGAVIGGLAAGGAGAVVASRQPISTSTEEHDTREIIVRKENGEQLSFPFTYYEGFIRLIPQLEYTYLQMKKLTESQ